MCRNSHVYWWGVSRAAVSVGVQVVEWAVVTVVGGVQQVGRAAAQRTWGAAAQQSRRTPAQQSARTPAQESGRTYARQDGRVSAEEAVAAHPRGAAVHEAGVPQQRQGGLCQGSLKESR